MRTLILVNPAAGNHEGARWLPALEALARRPGPGLSAAVEATRHGEIREQIAARGHDTDRVVVVGGDGTVREVLEAVHGLGLAAPVGIVPLGTGNDLARSLGMCARRPRGVEEILAFATSAQTAVVDLWSINDRLTFNNYMSLGMDAVVVHGFNRVRQWIEDHPPWGKRGVYFAVYILVWLRHVRERLPAGGQMAWTGTDGQRRSVSLARPRVLSVTNTPYYAAGALTAPGASVGDGALEVTLFANLREYVELMAMRVPALARLGVQGRWWRARAKDLELRLPAAGCIQADGEDVTSLLGGDPTVCVRHRGRVRVLLRGMDDGPKPGRNRPLNPPGVRS
jgi:diacylglycerol kinase (ATP)